MNLKRGYKAVDEAVKRSEEAQANAGKRLYRFFITKDQNKEDVRVRFLTEEPITYDEHTVKGFGGKWDNIPCSGDDCELCANGDKPSFKGAYLVYDYRTYVDKETKEERESGLRLYVQGQRVLAQLERISTKYGLSNRDVEIVRTGVGQNTSYDVDKLDEEELTEEEIMGMLPEKLREFYDGTQESLMDIVEMQIEMAMGVETDYNEDEDDEPVNDNIIGVDDDEPKSKKKSLFKKDNKVTENSAKRGNSNVKSQLRKKEVSK